MALYTSQAAANKRQKTVRDVSSRTNVTESVEFFAGKLVSNITVRCV